MSTNDLLVRVIAINRTSEKVSQTAFRSRKQVFKIETTTKLHTSSKLTIHHHSPVLVVYLKGSQFHVFVFHGFDWNWSDPKKIAHFKFEISNLPKTGALPKQKEWGALPLDLNEKRGSNLHERFVLKAETRLRRTIWRKKEEASRLGVGEALLLKMANHSPVIKSVEFMGSHGLGIFST